MENSEKHQLYNIRKVFKVSGRKKILEKGLTLEQAQRFVQNSEKSTRSMITFIKQ